MLSNRIALLTLVLALLGFASPGWSRDVSSRDRFLRDRALPWEITAERFSQERSGGLIVAEGGVVIRRGEQRLETEKAVYNRETGMAEVSGGFRLEADGDLLTGEEGVFDLRDATGRIVNGRLFIRENNVHLYGKWIERELEDTYRILDCKITTCDGERPDWSITGSQLELTLEGYGNVKHAAFRVKDWPIFYFPYFVFPAKTKRQSGILPPRAGYSSRNGLEIEVPFFWAISDAVDATFYQHYLSERGYMQGVELRYAAGEASRGLFLADVLSDEKQKDPSDPDDAALSPFPRTNDTRYWLRGRADQDLPWGFQARADLDYVSDQDYLAEFNSETWGYEARPDLGKISGRPLDDDRSPGRNNRLRAGRETQNLTFHATGTYWQIPQDEGEQTVAQPLAGLDLRTFPSRMGAIPAFFSSVTEYDYVWRQEGAKGHRMDLRPEIRLPLWLGPYVELEPSALYEMTVRYVDRDEEGTDLEERDAYQMALRMTTSLDQVFPVSLWGATAVKHRLRPTLSYMYRAPDAQEVPSPWFEPIDVPGRVNRVALTLDNFLDARLPGEKGPANYRQWASFTLSQGYNVKEARDEQDSEEGAEPFEPLTATMTLRPYAILDLYGAAAWDHDEGRLGSLDLALSVYPPRGGARTDFISLTYHYLPDLIETLGLEVLVNLAYGFRAGGALSRELIEGESVSSRAWVDYETRCWGIRIGAEKEYEDTRIMFVLRLKGLSEMKGL
jgi:LPS-assembly protein